MTSATSPSGSVRRLAVTGAADDLGLLTKVLWLMPIVSSIIADTNVQKDGRKWVREIHTDQVGVQYVRNYLAGAADDLNAALAAYATQLGVDINAAEIASNVAAITVNGSVAVVTSTYSTAAQMQTALRSAYQTATRVQAVMIGDFLSGLTSVQLQTLFSMTAAQVTTLRTNRLTPAATTATAIRAAAGQ